jgi:hypothetical protein
MSRSVPPEGPRRASSDGVGAGGGARGVGLGHRFGPVAAHSVRGDALLASVKRGGGSYRGPWYNVYRLAAGAVICEAILGGVVAVHEGTLVGGAGAEIGAMAELALQVREAPQTMTIPEWLEHSGPRDRDAIEAELASAGVAEGEVRRILLGTDERLRILNLSAQDQVFSVVHDVATGRRAATVDEALLVLLLGSAAMLQYHVRTMRGRRPRRILKELAASLPADVELALRGYERWQVHGAAD